MRALLAIAGRELRVRGSLLSLALMLGCVPVALAFSGAGVVVSARFAEMSVAWLAGAILVGLTALFSGWGLIAPEQSAGRLGFLFSRPLPWSSIWGGKLAAAVALPVAAGVLLLLPSLAADQGLWRIFWSTPEAGAELLGAGIQVLLLVGVGNAASIAYRSLPAQRAIDGTLLAGLLILLLKPSALLTVGALSFGYPHQAAVAQVPIALAALAATASQVGVGRTDSRRAHGVFSLTLWPLLYSSMAAVAGVGHLMATSPPSLLRRVERAEGAPLGGWVFVSGRVRWGQYAAAFLYEPASGRYVSLGSALHVSRLSFSRDGSLAAVVERDPLRPGSGRTQVVHLGAPVPTAETVFAHLAEDVAVSPDYLVALRENDWPEHPSPNPAPGWWHTASMGLDFYRLPAGGLVKSLPKPHQPSHKQLPWRWCSPFAFQHDGYLRIGWDGWSRGLGRHRIGLYLLDPERTVLLQEEDRRWQYRVGRLNVEPSAAVPVTDYGYQSEAMELRSNESGDRLLLQRSTEPRKGIPLAWRICLHASASGDHLRTLFPGPGSADADFLSDGLRTASGSDVGIAVAQVSGGQGSLRLLGAEGTELSPNPWREDLGPAFSVSLAGEPAPGYLVLGVRRSATDFGDTFVLGPSGSWREPGIYPVAPRAESQDSPGAGRPTAGSLGSRLFISEEGNLVRYDPETRARTVLLGRAGG